MKTFFVYLDILGFKNLVNNNSGIQLQQIVDLIFACFDSAVDKSRTLDYGSVGEKYKLNLDKLNFRLLSDSIMIWSNEATFDACRNLLFATEELLLQGIVQGVPLRGTMTYGNILVKNDKNATFLSNEAIYGKGLVEAYSLESLFEWSGCILTPSAWAALCKLWNSKFTNDNSPNSYFYRYPHLVWYDVPLKDGKCKKGIAVNWNIDYFYDEDYRKTVQQDLTVQKIEASFAMFNKGNGSPEKVNNTIQFFEYTKNLWVHFKSQPQNKQNIPHPDDEYAKARSQKYFSLDM